MPNRLAVYFTPFSVKEKFYNKIIIEINSKDISKLYCNKKQYFNEFKKNRHGKVFVKTVDKLKRGRVRVTVIEKVEEFKI